MLNQGKITQRTSVNIVAFGLTRVWFLQCHAKCLDLTVKFCPSRLRSLGIWPFTIMLWLLVFAFLLIVLTYRNLSTRRTISRHGKPITYVTNQVYRVTPCSFTLQKCTKQTPAAWTRSEIPKTAS